VVDPPLVSVVVASHGRPLRLRWLLNALEEQTLARRDWELVVVHDYDAATAARYIADHALARDTTMRTVAITPGTGSPARQRNLGWRLARARLVAFVDDDCRPEPRWLESLAEAARREPGAIIQGRVRPDPFEHRMFAAPHVRTLQVDPPSSRAQTANILYERELLESLEGFDEAAVAGEDVDLALRAQRAGRRVVGEPEAVVNHAVEAMSLPGAIRAGWKWHYLAYLVKRHPALRRDFRLGIFWEPQHADAALLVAALAGAPKRPALALLALPWLRRAMGLRGTSPLARVVALAEMPGIAVVDLAGLLTLAAGSARFRTLLL